MSEGLQLIAETVDPKFGRDMSERYDLDSQFQHLEEIIATDEK